MAVKMALFQVPKVQLYNIRPLFQVSHKFEQLLSNQSYIKDCIFINVLRVTEEEEK